MHKCNNEVTLVFVLYNDRGLIFERLEKLKNFKFIIANNGKNEQIIKKLNKYKNIIKIINNNKNLGMGAATNIASEYVDTKYFMLLSTDVIIEEKDIINLLDDVKKYKSIGGSPILNYQKDYYVSFPEKIEETYRSPQENNIFKIIKNKDIEGPCSVEWANGCSMLFELKNFNKIGKFNKKFFLYWEEIELCRRIRQFKLSYIVSSNSFATHIKSTSSKWSLNTFFIRSFHREYSRLLYYNKKKYSKVLLIRGAKHFIKSFLFLFTINFKQMFIHTIKFYALLKYMIRNNN